MRLSSPTLKTEMRSASRHSLIYLLGPAVSKAIGFLLIPVYTRFISPADFGVMSLADVFMSITMMLLAMGVGESMVRFYYETNDERQRQSLMSTVVFGVGLTGLPAIVVIILLAGFYYPVLGIGDAYVNYLRLTLFVAWLSMVAEIGWSYLRMRYLSGLFTTLLIFQVMSVLLLNLLFVVLWRQGIWGILYSTLIAQSVVAGSLTGLILYQSQAKPSWLQFKRILGFGLPLVPSVVTLQLGNYLNPLLIRWLLVGDPATVLAQVGLFAAGQRIGVVVNRFVTVPFNAFWRPRRMELALQGTEEVKRILARMCTYSTLVAAQVALLLSVVVEDLLRLVVNERYWDAWRIVPVVAAAYVVLGLEHHFAVGMYHGRKTIWATWIGMVALVSVVAVDLFFLPRIGILAGAIATLVGISLRVSLILIVSQRLYPISFEFRRLACIGLCWVMLFGLSRLVNLESTILSLAVRGSCGCLFIPLLLMLRFFWPTELRYLHELLARYWTVTGFAERRWRNHE